MSKFNDRQINYIIATLQGTCGDLGSTIEELFNGELTEEDLTEDNHQTIENEIFRCEECGWWYESVSKSEVEDESICDDCNEERSHRA